MKAFWSIIGILAAVIIIQYIRFRMKISDARATLQNNECIVFGKDIFPFSGSVCKDQYGNAGM